MTIADQSQQDIADHAQHAIDQTRRLVTRLGEHHHRWMKLREGRKSITDLSVNAVRELDQIEFDARNLRLAFSSDISTAMMFSHMLGKHQLAANLSVWFVPSAFVTVRLADGRFATQKTPPGLGADDASEINDLLNRLALEARPGSFNLNWESSASLSPPPKPPLVLDERDHAATTTGTASAGCGVGDLSLQGKALVPCWKDFWKADALKGFGVKDFRTLENWNAKRKIRMRVLSHVNVAIDLTSLTPTQQERFKALPSSG